MSCQRAPETEQLDVSDPCNYNIPLWSAKKKKLGSPTESKAVKHCGKRSFLLQAQTVATVLWENNICDVEILAHSDFARDFPEGVGCRRESHGMMSCSLQIMFHMCDLAQAKHKNSSGLINIFLLEKSIFNSPAISFVLLYFVFIFCSLVKQPHCSVLWWYRKHCSLSFTRIVHKLKTSTPKTWHYRKVLFQILRQPESLHISCSFNLESYWDRVIIYSSLKWIYNISIVKNCPLTQKEWLRLRMSNVTYDQNIKKDKILYKMLHIYIVLCCTQIARIFISSFSLLFFSIYCSYKQRGYLKVNSRRQNS